MKTKLLLVSAIIISLISCNNNAKEGDVESKSNTLTVETEVDSSILYLGEKFDETTILDMNQFVSQIADQDSLEATIKGKITSCCQKKGCWMTLSLENGEEMMVRFKDYGFFVPLDSEGKEVVIHGMAKKETVPVDELKHYAQDAGKTQEEIDKITTPKDEIRFLADGVVLINNK